MTTNSKPIAFFDLETTGVNISKDRIVEIAIIRLESDGKIVKYQTYLNPEISISEEVTKITGLKNDFLKDYPTFKLQAKGIADFMSGCNIAGHNIVRFDVPILVEEFLRVGIDFPSDDVKFIDTMNIQAYLYPRTLEAVYSLMVGSPLEKSNLHGAEFDTSLTMEIYKAQIDRLAGIDIESITDENIHNISLRNKSIVDFAGKLTLNADNEIVYAFGKNEGKLVSSDPSYAAWILAQDFTLNTKQWIKHALENKSKLTGQAKISF